MSEELHDYEALIGSFYSSFSNLNRAGMTKCYHRDIHFLDSAFGNLHGEDVSKMWEMLIARSKGNLEISFSISFATLTLFKIRFAGKVFLLFFLF